LVFDCSDSPIGVVSPTSGKVPIVVVETPEFLSATSKLMTDEERELLVDYLAYNPTSGDLIP
jgi:hypothetical protein